MEFEQFKGTIWKQGDSLILTIPANIVKFAGLEVGNDVKVMLQKIRKKDEVN